MRRCSGCSLLQVPYVKQLRDKHMSLRELFGDLVPVEPIVPCPDPFGYRSSTKMCVGEDDFGRPLVGLYERVSKNIVAIDECPVHAAGIDDVIDKLLRDRPIGLQLYPHNKRKFMPGRLKYVTVRRHPSVPAGGIVLSHTGLDRARLRAWVDDRRLGPWAVYEAELTHADGDFVLGTRVRHLCGPETFKYPIGALTYELQPHAFFQANFRLTDEFVTHIASVTGSGKTLLDLYGGFGAYSLSMHDQFEQLVVVNSNRAAVEAAEANAKRLDKPRLTAVAASCEDYLDKSLTAKAARSMTHMIVNPPRAGLSARVKGRLTASVFPALERLVYVSCDPRALARDRRDIETRTGLRLQRLTPFDMFPQTDHIELVAVFTRS
jgi:23S rRNA (uracil1939-C5)-methyltransferase